MTLTLGQLVRERRLALNLTQEALEGLTGVERSDISRIESGKKTLTSPAACVAMSNALGVPLDAVTKLAAGVPVETERPQDSSNGEVS